MSPVAGASRRITLKASLHGFLKGLTVAVAYATVLAVALLAFRLGAQFSSMSVDGLVTGALYGLGGTLATPFARFETVTPVREAGILEFSTVVAIEAYMFGGFVATLLLAASTMLARRYAPLTWSKEIDLQPAVDTWTALEPGLAGLASDSDAVASRLTRGFDARAEGLRSSSARVGAGRDSDALREAARRRMSRGSAGARARIEAELARMKLESGRRLSGLRERLDPRRGSI